MLNHPCGAEFGRGSMQRGSQGYNPIEGLHFLADAGQETSRDPIVVVKVGINPPFMHRDKRNWLADHAVRDELCTANRSLAE